MTYRILCYGDSNTFGYVPAGYGRRWDENTRWTQVLARQLKDGYEIIEEGCSGRTTDLDSPEEPWKNGLAGLKISLSSHKPIDLVILMLGTNDLKTVFHRNEYDIASAVKRVITEIQEYLKEKQGRQPEILLMVPPHLNDCVTDGTFGSEFSAESVSVSRRLALQYQKTALETGCLFLDTSAFLSPSKRDGVHLEAEEHRKLADAIFQHLNNHLFVIE